MLYELAAILTHTCMHAPAAMRLQGRERTPVVAASLTNDVGIDSEHTQSESHCWIATVRG
jgi:hypothetical protein